MRRNLIALALLGALLAGTTRAEVLDQSPAGFTCRTSQVLGATPDRVWDVMTGGIGRWWNEAHTWSGDAGNLFLDPVAGEEFGENLPGGGSVTHMVVIHADAPRLLRLRGSLGPLQSMAVTGVLSIELAAAAEGTRLTATYAVGGYTPDGLTGIAGAVDAVIDEQFTRLAAHLADR